MALAVDPEIGRLFGSGTRVRTLAILANTAQPLTGYRIAQISGDEQSKVYSELRRLEQGRLILSTRSTRGVKVWVIGDPDLRRFLRRRVRLAGSKEWSSRVRQVAPLDRTALSKVLEIDLSNFPPIPKKAATEFVRPPEKDRALAAARLPVSRRLRPR